MCNAPKHRETIAEAQKRYRTASGNENIRGRSDADSCQELRVGADAESGQPHARVEKDGCFFA